MDGWTRALRLLPEACRTKLEQEDGSAVEEIRLRCGRQPTLLTGGREQAFSQRLCREEDLQLVLEKASGASLHAVADMLKEGYLSVDGVRIGVCGTMLPKEQGGFRRVSSLCLRIPRECRGIARGILPALRENLRGGTLLLSPPGGGKTTLLRECIRCLSDGGVRVSVADERCELSGSEGGEGFDLGCHTDVLLGCGKAMGSIQLLRSMNPQLIAMDEISSPRDLEAVRQIAGCGVGILATAHALDPAEMRRRPLYRVLLDAGVFSLAVCIAGQGSERQYSLQRLRA